MNISRNNKRLAKNTLFLYLRMFILMGVTLYTSRVVLRVLGVEDFGIYDVVGGIAALFSSISSSISASSNRFIIYSFGKENIDETRKVFNTVLFLHVIVAFIIFIVAEIVGLYFFMNQLNIPPERHVAAMWVFHSTVLSIILLFFSFPYNSVIIAHEKIGIYTYLSILDVLLRLGIIFLLPYILTDNLIAYSVLVVIVQVIMQICYVIYCRIQFQETKLLWVWDSKLINELLSYMVWIFLGTLASIGYSQGLNILLNIYYGPAVNAARGIAVQVQSAVIKFSDNFQTAIKPQITISYAQHDIEHLHSLVNTGTKIMVYLLYMIILPIIINVDTLLETWLDVVPKYTGTFTITFLIICAIRTISSPLMIAIQANGNIKKVQIYEAAILLAILPVSYLLLKYYDVEPLIVLEINLLIEILSLIVRVSIVLPQVRMGTRTFFKDVLIPIVLVMVLSPILPSLSVWLHFHIINSLGECVMLSIISEISLLFWIYVIGISPKEKFLLKIYIKELCA